MKGPPPLRFLGAVVGGWVCVRAAMLMPGWAEERIEPEPNRVIATPAVPPTVHGDRSQEVSLMVTRALGSASLEDVSRVRSKMTPDKSMRLAEVHLAAGQPTRTMPLESAVTRNVAMPVKAAPLRSLAPATRWSGSAWAFVRQGSGPALGAGGMLGGSQIGGRIGYRINGDLERPLALTGRVYSPANRREGSEAAVGLEWKPHRELPVRLLAERRLAIGSEGRSAWALIAHGGVSDAALPGGARLEAYGQAGVVGARSRHLFADASVAVAWPLDDERRLSVGAAAWAAAQPGTSRLDAGPRLSLKLPGAERVRIVADWRFRLQGKAAPASGPSLTLATDF